MTRRDPLIRRNLQLRRAAYRQLKAQARRLGISVALLIRVLVAEWLERTASGRRDWDRGIPRSRDLARRVRPRRRRKQRGS